MSRVAIVSGGTTSDVAAMAVLAMCIKDTNPNLADELILFHCGIKKRDQRLIQSIFPTRFIRYKYHLRMIDRIKNHSLGYFSGMLFCKFECFKLLNEYDSVIWTDYDVLIKKDISELLENPQVGLRIASGTDSLRSMFYDTISEESVKDYNLDIEGVSTPLFVLNKSIGDFNTYYKWCYEMIPRYAKYIYLPEQCIISMLLQKFRIEYEKLPTTQYVRHPNEDDSSASILHAYSQPKFWNGLSNEKWNYYYLQWLTMGGTKYRKPLRDLVRHYLP